MCKRNQITTRKSANAQRTKEADKKEIVGLQGIDGFRWQFYWNAIIPKTIGDCHLVNSFTRLNELSMAFAQHPRHE